MKPTEDPVIDSKFMERCLILAQKAEGRTAPNPMVGAVVVDPDGIIVGEGFHARAGEPHAEVIALDAAGEKAVGATLYVSLEPCCHTGRTGPCSQRVIKSGVTRVVAGMEDPNPRVAGGGIKELRANSIAVDVGILEQECAWLNRAFMSRILRNRPWVCLKMATTLDGRIADRFGQSRYISGLPALAHVHNLRNRLDCVLVGGETARKDDPELTVRDVEDGRNPDRAVIDTKLTLPLTAKVFTDRRDGSRTFLFCSPSAAVSKKIEKYSACVSVTPMKENAINKGELDLDAMLRSLSGAGINSVLCEGGAKLATRLIEGKLVDEINWIVAPKILGDLSAVSAVGSDATIKLGEVLTLERVRISRLGDDTLIEGVFPGIEWMF